MAWTADFIYQISGQRIRPIYLLESLGLTGDRDRIGGSLKLSSAILPGYKAVLSPEGSRVSYGSLRAGDWTYTQAEWDIGLVNQNLGARDIRHYTARGQVVALKIGFPGWTTGQYQTVALGVVQDVAMSGGRWSIKVRSILAALTTRSSTVVVTQSLFHLLAETTLSVNYAAGAATVTVVDNAGAEKEASPGTNKYAIRITPNTGDPFIVTATGTTVGPDTFTGVSATAILGTTVANASSGKRVEILAYVQDHPLEVIRKVLCSTGAGTNGAFDTLPLSWGLAIDDSLIDDGDCRDHVTIHTPAGLGSAPWDVYSAARATDTLAWMVGVLAPMGGFLCERQGLLTIRAATTHFQPPFPVKTWDVYDSDLVDIDSYSAYDPGQPVEYSRVRVTDSHTGTNTDLDEPVDTMPALGTKRLDLVYVESNRPDWREHVRDAIGPYYTRIGEPVSITCRGWRLSQAAAGDHMQIHTSSDYLSGRQRGLEGSDLSTAAPVLITSVESDWFGATVKLTGHHITDADDE